MAWAVLGASNIKSMPHTFAKGLILAGSVARFTKFPKVLDRTKDLHGPQTQTYVETNYFKKKVLDRTKILHGPWTQTCGETSH